MIPEKPILTHWASWAWSRRFQVYFAINTIGLMIFLGGLLWTPHFRTGTDLLLVLTLCLLWPTIRYFPVAWPQHKIWILGLLSFGLYQAGYFWIDGGTLHQLDRPMRYAIGAFIFVHLLRTGFSKPLFWTAVLLGTLITSVLTLQEYFVSGTSRASLFHNPITLGNALVIYALLTLYQATQWRNPGLVVVFALVGVLGVVATLTTGTRGVWVTLFIAGLGLMAWLVVRAKHKRMMAGLIGALIGISTWVAITQVSFIENRIQNTRQEIQSIRSGDLNNSIGLRLQMWHTGLYVARQHPLVGNASGYVQQAEYFIAEQGYYPNVLASFSHLHNQLLDTQVKLGAIGLFSLMLMYLGIFWGLKLPDLVAGLIVFVSYFAGGLTQAVLSHGVGILLLIVIASALRVLGNQPEKV